MKLDDKKIKEILIQESYLTAEDVKGAEKGSKDKRMSFTEYLTVNKMITPDLIGQAVAEFYQVPYADLNSSMPSREQILKVPEDVGRKCSAILFEENEKEVIVATDDPSQKQLATKFQPFVEDKKIIIAYSNPEDIQAALAYYQKALETRFVQIIK